MEAETQEKNKIKSDLQESRDQVELLEFQVLELEEEINGFTKNNVSNKCKINVGTITEDILSTIFGATDSGCSSLEHSRSSSMSLDVEEAVEKGKDYRVSFLSYYCQ